MSARWTDLRHYQSYFEEQMTAIDSWTCILQIMIKTPLRRTFLKCNPAKTSGFLVLTHRMTGRRGMKDALKKVLITNVKLIDTLNHKTKPIFQYVPAFPRYLTDVFFLNSDSCNQKTFKWTVICSTQLPKDYRLWADKTNIYHSHSDT